MRKETDWVMISVGLPLPAEIFHKANWRVTSMNQRQKRKVARRVFNEAAKDFELTRREFVKLLKEKDDDAWAAVALVGSGEISPEFPWNELINMIWAIVEFLVVWLLGDDGVKCREIPNEQNQEEERE